jgi:hypothetical protein
MKNTTMSPHPDNRGVIAFFAVIALLCLLQASCNRGSGRALGDRGCATQLSAFYGCV